MSAEGYREGPKTQEILQWSVKRGLIIDRDGGRCLICSDEVAKHSHPRKPTANIHHLTPKSEGGGDIPENLVTLCQSCHTRGHVDGFDDLDADVEGSHWTHESVLLTETTEAILEWFDDQECSCATVRRISDLTGIDKEIVSDCMKQMMVGNYANRVYTPMHEYRLIEDPRQNDD